MIKKISVWSLKLFVCLFIVTFLACNQKGSKNDKHKKELYIIHAGSLSVPMKQLAEDFMTRYPEISVKLESGGSVANARKITEMNKSCDIFASSDYQVIDKMLIPKHADFNVKFATNELIIAYNIHSLKGDTINSSNWYKILLNDSVKFGRSDPNSDPCGYRTVLLTLLSEIYYNNKDIHELIVSKDTKFIRPKEVDLLALLESNVIDYVFIYKSVALQHNLKYIELPDSINLGNPDLNAFYKTVFTEITGNKPGEKIKQYGEAMIYSLTIPKNAENFDDAVLFLDYMLDKNEGRRIIRSLGQKDTVFCSQTSYTMLPSSLKALVSH